MIDPLSMTASILAVLSATYSSAKTLYELMDDLSNAPQLMDDIKTDLSSAQTALNSLKVTLKDDDSAALTPVFERVGLRSALEACSAICSDFTATIKKYTTHSTTLGLGKRDRLTITFRKSKLEAFRARLNGSKDTIELAVTSAVLYLTSYDGTRATSTASHKSTEELKALLQKQGQALNSQNEQLTVLENNMKDLAIDDEVEDDLDNDVISITKSDRDLTLTILPVLKQVCEQAFLVTNAQVSNTYQKFGNITAEEHSRAQAGIAGADLGSGNANQLFGGADAKKYSEIFVGRMGNEAFKEFWNRPLAKPDTATETEKGSR